MVVKYARDTGSGMDIETEMVHVGNVPQRIYYPRDLGELDATTKILRARELYDVKDCTEVYPIISLKKNNGTIKTPMLLNLIPANLCDADDVLEHAFPESTHYPIAGASNIQVGSLKCRMPRSLFKDILKTITEYRGYRSVVEVHADIVTFLKNFYEVPDVVSPRRTYTIRTMGMQRLTPEQQGARLGAFSGAYMFLVTRFCLYNPLMRDREFTNMDNAGMHRFLSHEYFFSDVFDSVSLVTENYLNHETYFLNIVEQALLWVTGINKSLESGTPFFASESLRGLFSDEFMAKNRDNLFESIYYEGKFHVLCFTPSDLDRMKAVVSKLKDEDNSYDFTKKEVDQILKMGLFFVDTPELKRTYRLELLRQGVADHLKLTLGGVS